MITTLLLVGVASFGTVDTPIEPIDSTTMETGIAAGLADDLCLYYGQAYSALVGMIGDPQIASDVMDGYSILMFEDGYGHGARLTLEAQTVFTDFLHSCPV